MRIITDADVNGKKVYIIDNGYALICLENKLDVSIIFVSINVLIKKWKLITHSCSKVGIKIFILSLT